MNTQSPVLEDLDRFRDLIRVLRAGIVAGSTSTKDLVPGMVAVP